MICYAPFSRQKLTAILFLGSASVSASASVLCMRTVRIHWGTEHPLAKGFDLSQGQVQVKVPSVNPSDHYIVVCECRSPALLGWSSSPTDQGMHLLVVMLTNVFCC